MFTNFRIDTIFTHILYVPMDTNQMTIAHFALNYVNAMRTHLTYSS